MLWSRGLAMAVKCKIRPFGSSFSQKGHNFDVRILKYHNFYLMRPICDIKQMRKCHKEGSSWYCECSGMGACGKDEEWQQALYFLKRLRGEGVEQHTITYNTAISTCEKSEKWQQCLCLLGRMPTDGRTMLVRKESNGSVSWISAKKCHSITYNAAISTCEKSEKWQQGLCLLESMLADGWTMLVRKASNGSMS